MGNRTVVITGAAAGIGRETALLLAEQGWNVVVSDLPSSKGEEVVSEIKSNGGEASFVPTDVSEESQVKSLIEEAIKIYGKLDGAVNNAGIGVQPTPFVDLTTADFEKTIKVNLYGVFWCMKYSLQHMIANGSGSIVNTASIGGISAVPTSGAYSATKHAVVGMTRTAALDHAKSGVTINAVAPGAIQTGMMPDSPEIIERMSPVGRLGRPRDIAEAISFLLNSRFTTGSVLAVDGGYTA